MEALLLCPAWAPALGFGGATIALSFSCLGSAYGTGKAGVGVSSVGVEHPALVMKSMIPVIMAGVLGIYGLIVAVIIGNDVTPLAVVPPGGPAYSDYSLYTGYAQLSAGLCCGMSALAAGIAIGIVGDAGVRAHALKPKTYVGMVLILIFAEALGLYGLIVGLILTSQRSNVCVPEGWTDRSLLPRPPAMPSEPPPPSAELAPPPAPLPALPRAKANPLPSVPTPRAHRTAAPPRPPAGFLGGASRTAAATGSVALLGALAVACLCVRRRRQKQHATRELSGAPLASTYEMCDRRQMVPDRAWDEARKLIVDHLADRMSTDEESLNSPH
ncbi:hypothetical protein AB1Y20_023441 [Prymnesium parvum]|uniref:V-type proton ATPase proteolipid subunit n=1 Tax=Prymnesium parvum TaxID=97485 RepID=A0AB34JGE8_PRYPA